MRTIVVATDGSPSTSAATDTAIGLAKDLGARLVVTSVEEPAIAPYDGFVYENGLEKDRVDRVLAETETLVRDAGVPVETVHLIGPPAEEICAEAERDDAELIVVGAHGWGAMGRILHGSVSTEVVHRSPRPVLVVRGKESS